MYRPIAVLVFAASLTLPVVAGAVAPRIVGGHDAGSGTYPFMAAMVDSTNPDAGLGQICGATLIAPRLALTAGHCVIGAPTDSLDVVVGRSRLSATDGVRVHVIGVALHPSWNVVAGAPRFDVALLRLESDVPGIDPAPLAAAGTEPADGSDLEILGWGQSNLDGAAPDDLQEATVQRVADAACRTDYGVTFDPATMLCAGTVAGGVDSCFGDSGGPILHATSGGYEVIGTVSTGISCGVARFPGIYARVTAAALHDWIVSDPPDTPIAADQPAIVGDANVGSALTCLNGAWTPEVGVTFSFAWRRDDTLIGSATSDRYRLTDDDRGASITCIVSGSNASGTVPAESFSQGPVGPRLTRRDERAPSTRKPTVRCRGTRCTFSVLASDHSPGTGVAYVEFAVRSGATLAIVSTRSHVGARYTTRRRLTVSPPTIVFARAVDRAGNVEQSPAKIVLASKRPRVGPRPHIIDGLLASTSDFPFMAAIVSRSAASAAEGQFCGGSLIAPTLVITAAHCAQGVRPEQIDVVLGQDVLSNSDGQRIHVVGVSWHPSFSFDSLRYDVALLRLEHAPAAPVVPVPLVGPGDASRLLGGEPATVVGWGATYDSPDAQVYPDELRRADVVLGADSDCAREAGRTFFATTMTCATTTAGRNVCNGDSGGPLLVPDGSGGYLLAGLTSWGWRCGSTISPAVFTRVPGIRSWVDSGPPDAPIQVRPVYLDGTLTAGSPVLCHTDGAFILPTTGYGSTATYSYLWFNTFELVDGSTDATYTPSAADPFSLLLCAVKVANNGGSAEAISDLQLIQPAQRRDVSAPVASRIRVACTTNLASGSRSCNATLNARDRGTGVAYVTFLVDVTTNGKRTTQLKTARSSQRIRLPLLRKGATYRIAARAFDSARHGSRVVHVTGTA